MTTAPTNASVVYCTKCRMSLPPAFLNRPELIPCPVCGSAIMVAAFPVLLTGPATGTPGEVLLADDQASCFYHPSKKASRVCDQCGRFLCALCDVEMGGRHLCPGCIEGGDRQKHTELDTRRVLYDSLALFLAVLVPLLGGLIALYLAIRYWSAPTSLLRRTQVRWVLAVVVAVVQIAFWSWVFFY